MGEVREAGSEISVKTEKSSIDLSVQNLSLG